MLDISYHTLQAYLRYPIAAGKEEEDTVEKEDGGKEDAEEREDVKDTKEEEETTGHGGKKERREEKREEKKSVNRVGKHGGVVFLRRRSRADPSATSWNGRRDHQVFFVERSAVMTSI